MPPTHKHTDILLSVPMLYSFVSLAPKDPQTQELMHQKLFDRPARKNGPNAPPRGTARAPGLGATGREHERTYGRPEAAVRCFSVVDPAAAGERLGDDNAD
jgi:hypothetical protein